LNEHHTTLIVCRDPSAIPVVSAVVADARGRCVVAAEDPVIRLELAPVAEVCWIEQMDSLYLVAPDVIRLLDRVNEWLRSLADERSGFPANLLCWMQHAEGGSTTQRLQDLTLLIRSYLHLLMRYDVDRVLLCRNATSQFEDDVLTATAASVNISVETISDHCESRSASTSGSVPQFVKGLVRVPYRVIRQSLGLVIRKARTHWDSRNAPIAEDGAGRKRVAFQLANSEDKHIDNILPLMRALRALGFEPVALTCLAPEAALKIRNAGLSAEDAIAFTPFFACVDACRRVLYTLKRARLAKPRFIEDRSLSFGGVSLGPLLWSTVELFLQSELAPRYALAAGLRRSLEVMRPAAMKLWGAGAYVEGYLARKAFAAAKPMVFDYDLGVTGEWPYVQRDNPIDMLFTTGLLQSENLQSRGMAADRMLVVGMLRHEGLARFKVQHSPEASRRELGIAPGYALHVFWDPNAVVRGFMTTQEQLCVTELLIAVAEARSIALIIKPHPSHLSGALERLLTLRQPKNVFWIPGHEQPYHALNASDLVLTKISTVGLEGMLLDKAVISVVLDGEQKWEAVFRRGVEYAHTPERLDELLTCLSGDAERRDLWISARLRAQEQFLNSYFHRPMESPANLAAVAIAARLTRQSAAPLDGVLSPQYSSLLGA